MQDELVDIVNVNNRVLYQALKKEAHEKGLLHRCVVSEIKDSQGNWILIKQASDRQDAGQYVSPVGGHVAAGEGIEDALKREAFEEVGLKDFKYKHIGEAVFNRLVLNRQENHLFVLFEISSDDGLRLNHESVEYRKFNDNELKQELKNNPRIFGDAFFFVIKKFYPQLLVL